MITHSELDSAINRAAFFEWQRSLIFQGKRHKNLTEEARQSVQQATAKRQRALTEAIAQGPWEVSEFLCEMLDTSNAIDMLKKLPNLPNPLTESEISQTTFQVDREVSTALNDWGITPLLAAESSFWALCHARWIGDRCFPDGVQRVFAGGHKNVHDSEAMTRTFLRKVCGLPVERGNTSVITDCPLSAAWWRYRMATEISNTLASEGENLTVEEVHRVLQGSVLWETLVMRMIRTFASVNSPRARAAIVFALHDYSEKNRGRAIPREILLGCMQQVAQLGDRFSFALIDWTRLADAAFGAINNEVQTT